MSKKQIILACGLSVLAAAICNSQTIATRTMTPGAAIPIALSPQVTTTLLLPAIPSGTFGLGLITANNSNAGGLIQIDHPDGSPIIVLHPLSETAAVTMTVLMEGHLFVFDLRSAPRPDVAVTLVKADVVAPRAQEVTPKEIAAQRPRYDPEILIGLLRRARDSAVLAPLYKDLYAGYSKRDAQYTSESRSVKTTVTTIPPFSKEDAIVLQGVAENETDHPISFDGRATTVQVANEVHPAKLTDCLRPIPAHTKTLIDVVLQGDIDGGRANLSIDNEFRIILPGETSVWSFKNGGTRGKFNVPAPVPAIPLTQAGAPKKEAQ